MKPDSVLFVMTNAPDADTANRIARELVERRLAACVNVMAPCRSVYRWQGAVEEATELPLLIKTTAARYGMLEEALLELHPYDVPEIIATPVSHGSAEYLRWVVSETGQ